MLLTFPARRPLPTFSSAGTILPLRVCASIRKPASSANLRSSASRRSCASCCLGVGFLGSRPAETCCAQARHGGAVDEQTLSDLVEPELPQLLEHLDVGVERELVARRRGLVDHAHRCRVARRCVDARAGAAHRFEGAGQPRGVAQQAVGVVAAAGDPRHGHGGQHRLGELDVRRRPGGRARGASTPSRTRSSPAGRGCDPGPRRGR